MQLKQNCHLRQFIHVKMCPKKVMTRYKIYLLLLREKNLFETAFGEKFELPYIYFFACVKLWFGMKDFGNLEPVIFNSYLSRVVRKPVICICENKDADQLRSNREADQRLCFRYTDSTIPHLPKFEISSL